MKKQILLILSLILLSLSIVSAQTTEQVKTISGGVVNGKATFLAVPSFPAAAKAVKASGTVNVQVTIDEEGNVIAAEAVSGHPLLRAASVKAARESKFNPTILNGQPVKVNGVIVYNFNAEIATDWFQVGMLLSALEKSPTLRFFEPDVIARMLPPDWSAEKQQVQRLNELKKAEMDMEVGDQPKERTIDKKTTQSPDGSTTTTTITKSVTVSPERKASSEAAALAQSLINSIQGRLAADSLHLWNFNLGIKLNEALLNADSRSADSRFASVKPFREFIKTAPPEIPKEITDELQKMASLMEKGIFTDADQIQFTDSLTKVGSYFLNK